MTNPSLPGGRDQARTRRRCIRFSSSEADPELLEEVRLGIEAAELRCVPWETLKKPGPAMDPIVAELDDAARAVVVLDRQDGEVDPNLWVEFGLAVGALGTHRVVPVLHRQAWETAHERLFYVGNVNRVAYELESVAATTPSVAQQVADLLRMPLSTELVERHAGRIRIAARELGGTPAGAALDRIASRVALAARIDPAKSLPKPVPNEAERLADLGARITATLHGLVGAGAASAEVADASARVAQALDGLPRPEGPRPFGRDDAFEGFLRSVGRELERIEALRGFSVRRGRGRAVASFVGVAFGVAAVLWISSLARGIAAIEAVVRPPWSNGAVAAMIGAIAVGLGAGLRGLGRGLALLAATLAGGLALDLDPERLAILDVRARDLLLLSPAGWAETVVRLTVWGGTALAIVGTLGGSDGLVDRARRIPLRALFLVLAVVAVHFGVFALELVSAPNGAQLSDAGSADFWRDGSRPGGSAIAATCLATLAFLSAVGSAVAARILVRRTASVATDPA